MRELYLNTPAGFVRQRGLRTDVRLVCVQCDGLLSGKTRLVGKYEIGSPPISGNEDAPARWKDLYGTAAGGEQGKLLHSICQTQR